MVHERFLIIRLSAIGDVLHCTPVARALRQFIPSAHISWVVGETAADILQDNPFIDEVVVWSREKWETHLRRGRIGEALRMWQQLRTMLSARCYDVALDVHGLFLSGMVAAASGAPRRIGLAGTRELNSLFMTETAPAVRPDAHVIARYLSVLRPLGINSRDYDMTVSVPAAAQEFAEHFLLDRGFFGGRPLIGIVPATSWPSKNWPPDHYAAMLNDIGRHSAVILCGGPADKAIAGYILAQTRVPVMNAVGQTNLLQLAGLLASCDAVVAGDTGPLHMAAALGVPTISIFGPSRSYRVAPLGSLHSVLTVAGGCRECGKQRCRHGQAVCMSDVLPCEVVAALEKVLPASHKSLAPGRRHINTAVRR